MVKKIFFVPALLGVIACNSGNSTSTEEATSDSTAVAENETEAVSEFLFFGDSITFDEAISMEEMMTLLDEKDSALVKVQGAVSAVCTKKGCWMSMELPSGENMHVSYDYAFLLPTGGIEGKAVVVEGMVKKKEISVAHLRHLAEDAGKTQEEIDAIVEPETKVSLLATGVTIKS